MDKWLGRFSGELYAILRIVSGFLFMCHGGQKMLGWFGGIPPEYVTNLTRAAGIIELVGGLLIMIGLCTSWAAFICSGQMAFAYFIGHFDWPGKILPAQNGGDPAVLYCFLFLYMAARGAGKWSVASAAGKPALN